MTGEQEQHLKDLKAKAYDLIGAIEQAQAGLLEVHAAIARIQNETD